jgi:hypothetical protein
VIIYKKCKYAVLPSQIDSHFTPKRPYGYTKQERQRIANQVAEIGGLRQDEEALKQCEFLFPIDTSEPIAALKAPRTGGKRYTYRIEGGEVCLYVCGSRQQI